jgi:hypothetical protein
MPALAFLVGLAVSVAFVSGASAQTTVVTPQPGGGYRAQTLGGPTTIVTPTGNGGYRAQTLGAGLRSPRRPGMAATSSTIWAMAAKRCN